MKTHALSPIARRHVRPLLAVLLFGLATLAGAYTHMGTSVPIHNGLLYWPDNSMIYHIWSGTSDALPNIVPGSDPVGAVDQAFRIWQAAADFTFPRGADTDAQDVDGYDGINLVTFADTGANRAILAGSSGKAIITFDEYNEIHDIDIAFNPGVTFTTLATSSDPKQAKARPLFACALKQAGSCLSLANSPIESSAMMIYLGGRQATTEAGRLGTFLTQDDLIAANVAYPRANFFAGKGTITGLVTLNGERVYGAHVVAVEQSTGIVVSGNVTLGDNQDEDQYGRYTIKGLPPGRYLVYAEPTDTPYTPANWEGDYGWGDYWGGEFTTDYQTTFLGGNATPAAVNVTADGTSTVNIAVRAGIPSLVPIENGLLPLVKDAVTSNAVAGVLAVHTPLVLAPGERRTVAIAGVGLAGVDITSSDSALTVDLAGRQSGVFHDGIDWVTFELVAPAGAAEGPRNLVFRSGDEVAVMTGAIYIDPQKPISRNSAGDAWADYR